MEVPLASFEIRDITQTDSEYCFELNINGNTVSMHSGELLGMYRAIRVELWQWFMKYGSVAILTDTYGWWKEFLQEIASGVLDE